MLGEPILARPSTAWERTAKWVKRRPAFAGLIGVSIVAAVALLVVGLVYDARLGDALQAAAAKRQEAAAEHDVARQARAEAETDREETRQVREHAREVDGQARRAEAQARTNQYLSQVLLGHSEWLSNNVSRAAEALAACPADLRHWEWHYLAHACQAERLVLARHTGAVLGSVFSPNGRRLATWSWDGSVRSGTQPQVPSCAASVGTPRSPPRSASVPMASLSPRLRLNWQSGDSPVIRPSTAGEIVIWDASTGEKLLEFGQEHHGVHWVAFHPDGKRLVSSGWDENVRIWDVAGKELHRMKVKKELHGATFSPDGKEIAAWAGNSIQVWDAETYKDLFTITTIFRENTQHGFCYSPDSKRIAVVGDEGPIHLWDASNGKPALSLRGHGALVTALAFTPDGKRLVSGGADGLVKVWDLAGRRELWTLRAHEGMVTSAAISPDGLTLATSGAEIKREMFGRMWGAEGQGPPSAVKLWDATAGQDGCRIDEPITAVAFSPTEPHIALAARDGHEVRIIDASCKQLRAVPAFKEQVNRLCYSPDGKSLAVALLQRTITIDRYDVLDSVKILDADTGKVRLDLGRAGGELADVGFTPDGRWVVLGFERGSDTVPRLTNGCGGHDDSGRGGYANTPGAQPGRPAAGARQHDGDCRVVGD